MAPRTSSPTLQLFEPGLVEQIVRRPVRPARLGAIEGKIAVVALAWVPLAILAAFGGTLVAGANLPFAKDFAVHVRFFFELPMLLVAPAMARPLTKRAIAYLDGSDLIPAEGRAEFRRLIESTRRASRSPFVSIALLALALVASWAELSSWLEMVAPAESSWRARGGTVTNAGVWYALVARPILYSQLLLWLYRFLLWTRILARTARIARPIPAHPDGVGGLSPLNAGHDGFAVIALVVGADLAAALANRMVHLHTHFTAERTAVLVVIVGTTFLLLSPMLFFVPALYRARVQALFTFSSTATGEARRIDRAISASEPGVADSFKEHGHIAESLRRVRELRLIPVQRTTLVIFVSAVTVPFVLAALTELSIPEVLGRLHGLVELEPPTGGKK